MNAKSRLTVLVVVMLGLLFGVQFSANAFFTFGEFNDYGKLLFNKWSYPMLVDENNDGDISGPDEGVEIMLEGGSLGFTDEEQEIVKEAFQVWQDVPTAYIGFQFSGPTSDFLLPIVDLINYFSIAVPPEPFGSFLPTGVLGLTIPTMAVADYYYTTGDASFGFMTTRGQILEMDVIISSSYVRPAAPGEDPAYDLKAICVHEIGHLIGMAHTPLNNVTLGIVNGAADLVESPVLAMRDATNTLQGMGATPTMFPIYFWTEDGEGDVEPGCTTLAPDDIGGVSFLYPRGSQDMFFSMTHEVRTQSRPNLPSIPLTGMHIVAWCDVDNDPTSPRVPLFSTMSGLYERQPLLGGRFMLYNMYKEFEAFGTPGMFQASYTFTSSQLTGTSFTKQAPPGYSPTDFDSIEGGLATISPLLTVPSEVFHENGNIFDMEKADLGTPLAFDRQRSTVVSLDTGKTLPTMLPADRPMFGDPSQICPLTVITTTGSLSATTPAALRAFRDNVLLKTAVGTALVDAYYQSGPAVSQFLLRHPRVLRMAGLVAGGVEWMAMHVFAVIGLLAFVAVALLVRRRRVAAVAGLVLLACMAGPADASVIYMSDETMVAASDQIVTGKVSRIETTNGYFAGYNGLLSDVTLEIQDTMKGGANKSSELQLRMIGGQNSLIATYANELPTFTVGEEVILYLEYRPQVGYLVVGGKRGKMLIGADSKSGEKYVIGQTPEASAAVAETAAAIAKSKAAKSGETEAAATPEASQGRVSLDEYKQYIRAMVKEQKSAK